VTSQGYLVQPPTQSRALTITSRSGQLCPCLLKSLKPLTDCVSAAPPPSEEAASDAQLGPPRLQFVAIAVSPATEEKSLALSSL